MQQVRTSSDGNNNFEIARFAICPDNNGIYSEPQDLNGLDFSYQTQMLRLNKPFILQSHKPIENQNCEMNKQNEDKESFSAYPGKNAHSVCNVNDKFTEQDVLGAGNSQKMTLLGKRTLSDESSESNSFPAMSGYNIEDAEELEMLESFAKEFKQKRIKMNFTQGDVGAAMGKLYGNDFSQTTISRFEALNLSCKNMVKLKPLLERWLIDANRAVYKCQKGEPLILSTAIPLDPNLPPRKKRKKRTSIDPKQKEKLDKIFIQNPRPSSEALLSIAENCQMEKEVVRVWFCNRRQKAKRMQDSTVGEDETSSPGSPYTATISPESHHYLQQSNSTQLSITSGSSNKSTPGSSESTSSFLKSKTEQDSTTAAVVANDWTCNKPASSTSMMHSSRHLNSSLNTLVSNMNGLSAVVDNRQPPSEHTDSSKAAAYGNYNLARAALSSTPVGNHFSPLQTHMFLPNASSELNHSILMSKAAASVDRVPPAISALSGKPPLLLDAQHPQNQQSNANSNDMSVRSLFLNSQSAVVQNELFPASMVESSVAGSSPLMATVGASQSHTFAAFSKYAAAAAAARNILSNSPCAQPQLLSSDPKSDMALANGVAYPFLLPGQRQNDS